ncbi:MAG: signal transduction histidine kinase/CheY-like chemotaxis protein [Halioglobus sp.]|jgi:signal transduction histidine kinase/CheY-like chemotaxis protein/ligand-binding sensor domain-containing protein
MFYKGLQLVIINNIAEVISNLNVSTAYYFGQICKSNLKFVLLVLSCFWSLELSSQSYTVSVDEYGFEDGLIYYQINDVYEDNDGILWIGTSKGLVRYDGEEFKVWNDEDETGLIFSIKRIIQDDEGILWLWNSELHEFVFFNPISEEIQSVTSKFGNNFPIFSNANSDTGGISFSTSQLFKSRKDEIYFSTDGLDFFYKYNSKDGFSKIVIPNTDFIKINGIVNDTVFLSTESRGNCKYFENEIFDYNISDQRRHKKLLLIRPNKKTQTIFSRKQLLEKVTELFVDYEHSSMSSFSYDVSNELFYHFDRKRWICINSNQDTIFTILPEGLKDPNLFINENSEIDDRGNIWVYGHFGLVRIKVEENKFRKILYEKNGGNIALRGLTTNEKYLYVCGENTETLYKFDRKTLELIDEIKFDSYPRAAAVLGSDNLIIGKENVNVINNNFESETSWKFHPKDNYWWGDNYGIWSFYVDENETIWAGKGVYLAKKEKNDSVFNVYEPALKYNKKSNKNYCILSIIPEGNDSLWVCSENGLMLIDSKRNKVLSYFHEDHHEFLPASKFYHIHKDKNGIYWVGTNKGLIKWDGTSNESSFKIYTVKDNFSNDVIYAVYGDDDGQLWLASDNGIMRFDKESEVVHTYLEKNGISHYEFNRTSHHQDKDGTIYFGGLNGATVFHPKNFSDKKCLSHKMLISNFEIFDSDKGELINQTADIRINNHIIFKPSDMYFRLSFALPTFDGKNNKMYAWQIDGLHSDWTYQTNNSIELGYLPYGTYKLVIKGRSKESSWSSEQLEIKLSILKPFYREVWFILLCLFGVISGLVTLFKLKTKFLKEKIQEATEQIISDKQVIETQKNELQKLDKLKTQFFTNVSHELRTPLTLMIGPIIRLKRTIKPNSENGKMLDMLYRNATQLKNLVNEILDLSKLEGDKMKLELQPVNLYSFFNNHIKQYVSYGQSKNITFESAIEINKDAIFLFDRKKVEKVLNNLLTNAIKFTNSGGTVFLSVKTRGNLIKIEVRDTGRGIHPDDIDHIFNRFYQSKNQSSYDGGTGIGLSLSKELTHVMGGELSVQSILGQGSTFFLSLPCEKSFTDGFNEGVAMDSVINDEMKPIEPLALTPSKDKVILIVEDNIDLREYQEIILSDYKVVLTENGKDAMDYLEKGRMPDLIISDLMMPVMDGLQLIEKVKASDKFRHLPFIMLTAKTNQQVKIKALRYGIDDYLTKPFDEEEFKVRVANLLYFQKLRLSVKNDDINLKEESKNKNGLSQPDLDWLEKLESYIIKNVSNDLLNVSIISNTMLVSESTLLRQLKKLTGMTPGKYLQEIRLNQAREYLINRSFKSVSLVASKVGFRDATSFSRSFKKRFGKSPSEITL